MIVKGHRVYRGRRGAGRSGSPVLLTILVLVLLGLLLAFSLLPEYVVYHRDGVEMVVPMLQEDGKGYTVEGISAPVPYTGDASAAIQVAEPDYTNVSLASSAGLQYLTGYYVPFSKVNANGLLASANPDVALRDRTGAPYVDESGGWVDLWNRDVRTYIEELCTDLMAMGVDEIILSRVEHPFAEVMYTREIASSLNREAFCMNFSIAVREAIDKTMKDKNVHLSARVPHDVLTTGTDNGQSMDNFLKVYDRLVIETETYSDDAPLFTEKKIDSTLRFVPQMTWTFGGGSWILDPTVGASK